MITTIHTSNAYSRKEINCGGDYSQFLSDDKHLCDTIISVRPDLSSNKFLESMDSFLSSLQIAGEKYRIYLSNTDTTPNITIQKVNERNECNTILEVTDDKVVIASLGFDN